VGGDEGDKAAVKKAQAAAAGSMRGSKGGRTGRAPPPFSLEGIFLTLIIFAQGSK